MAAATEHTERQRALTVEEIAQLTKMLRELDLIKGWRSINVRLEAAAADD